MINHLLEAKACSPKVVQVMDKLRRQWFLPIGTVIENLRPISIGHNQTMSAPFIVASMTELLELSGDENVLEIGSGCGYQTAVLLGMGVDVYSIEYIPELADFGRKNLEKLGLSPNMKCADGYFGWPEEAPFDRIIIAATASRVPVTLVEQLKIGGKMVFPLKKGEREFMVRLTKNTPFDYDLEWLYGVVFVPFVGAINHKI